MGRTTVRLIEVDCHHIEHLTDRTLEVLRELGFTKSSCERVRIDKLGHLANEGLSFDKAKQTLLPLISAMNYKMRLDHSIWDGVRDMSINVKELEQRLTDLRPEKKRTPSVARASAAGDKTHE